MGTVAFWHYHLLCHHSVSLAATNLLPSNSPTADLQEATSPSLPAAATRAPATVAPSSDKQKPSSDVVHTHANTRTQYWFAIIKSSVRLCHSDFVISSVACKPKTCPFILKT